MFSQIAQKQVISQNLCALAVEIPRLHKVRATVQSGKKRAEIAGNEVDNYIAHL